MIANKVNTNYKNVIDTAYDIYVRVTEKKESETADKFEEICSYL